MDTQLLSVTLQGSSLLKIVLLGMGGFLLSMALTPLYTTVAYRWQLWKKPRTETLTGTKATMFMKLHGEKHKRHIPTMAGVVFIVTVALLTLSANWSRAETWLPLTAFVGAALIGLIDDVINLRGDGTGKAGLPSKLKFLLITSVAALGGWYFYYKLGFDGMQLPGFDHSIVLGWWIIPLFTLVVVATANAVNISDGLDGLAGGLATIAFAAYTVIALLEQKYGIAGFCATVVGALMSYTWFNVFPARFFMGDVGSFALGTALGVVAMYTDTVLLLPVIGLVFVAEAGSVILQIASKKLRGGKKLFRISPIHHHFEAIGWPEAKVTMRFWVIGQVAALIGLAIFVMGRYG
ncbi:phospho-N-acetylmuramoyl-pentapeptide-transferase [Candidatus Saccharibacteria bacterium]|nr:MAG: phospho-N-acetylmuramoyl-pentapeptide-transferase [Candidatus Saccharibacteria bacterium]PID99549.1 MAG: phospho-N-acetylmuramoyl-pentapeptide-transferase [Candidatus Saccharibacteria bacterium]